MTRNDDAIKGGKDAYEMQAEGGEKALVRETEDEPGISIALAASITPFVLSNAQYLANNDT
jgi:hypothetical protein